MRGLALPALLNKSCTPDFRHAATLGAATMHFLLPPAVSTTRQLTAVGITATEKKSL